MNTAPASSRISLSAAIMTVSDSRSNDTDSSGDYLAAQLAQDGHICQARSIVPNDIWQIRHQLCEWIASNTIQVVIINGGTGYTHGKSTIAAVAPLMDRTITGFGELFRTLSWQDVGSSAMQSEALAGLAGPSLVFCVPGSTGACRLAWEQLIREQLDSRHTPCNFATMYSRASTRPVA